VGLAPVLLVEDDDNTREILSAMIYSEGFDVVLATGGADALKQLEQVLPCAIVLDCRMPGMDGRAFRLEQKRRRLHADVPVILYSAEANMDVSEMDVSAVILKHAGIGAILEAVCRACASS
jgi:two-component system, OmpR family, response regulator